MDTQAFITIIGSVGFPIAVAAYLLTTFKKSLDDNTRSNQAISAVLQNVCDKLNIDKPKT